MTLITGTPVGNVITPPELYLDQPPTFWIQERYTTAGASVGLLNSPDADGFYWGLSGTTANPVYEVGCYENFVVADVRTINMVRCDTTGMRTAIGLEYKALIPTSKNPTVNALPEAITPVMDCMVMLTPPMAM